MFRFYTLLPWLLSLSLLLFSLPACGPSESLPEDSIKTTPPSVIHEESDTKTEDSQDSESTTTIEEATIPLPPRGEIDTQLLSLYEIPSSGYVELDNFDQQALEQEYSDIPAADPLNALGMYASEHFSLSEEQALDITVYTDCPMWMPQVYFEEFEEADVGFALVYIYAVDQVSGPIPPITYDLTTVNDYYKLDITYEPQKTGNYQIHLFNYNPDESHLCWLSVNLRPSITSQLISTPFGKMTLYRGKRIPLSIQYPSEWIVGFYSPMYIGNYPITLRHSEYTNSQLTITEPSLQELVGLPEMSLEELTDIIIYTNQMEMELPDFALISRETIELQNNNHANIIVFSSDGGQRMFYRLIYIHDNGITFHFTYAFYPSEDDIKSLIDYSFSTLSFEN
jgi:hypothetical protein